MTKVVRTLAAVVLALSPALVVGCGKGPMVAIVYDHPAEYNIPGRIRKVAITEFGGKGGSEKKWGSIAADRLASQLDKYNKKFHRYVLYDRQRIAAILAEQDFQAAISDTGMAAKAGKIANVDAMIYGTVHVTIRQVHTTRRTFDPLSRSMRTVPHIQTHCMAAVNFTMEDVATSRTLATVSVTRDWDSDKKKKSGGAKIGAAMGIGAGKVDNAQKIAVQLIDQCVAEILRKISPHQETVEVQLSKCKSKVGKGGHTFAKEKEYADALEMYVAAIEEKPDDHGALFNAGVMHEVMGRPDKAAQFYSLAIELKKDARYIRARSRVRELLTAAKKISEEDAKITAEQDFKRTLTDPSDEEEAKTKSAAPATEKEAEITPGVTTGGEE
ncbi:MAG: CsgG/HfaB family protein [Phycisphaerae bacterium]|nr:CsgG/HfaB family protein [Phycisphaerae bacterium]